MRGRALYKEMALAALSNSETFFEEAKQLTRRRSKGHGCAFAVLGMEEAAKSIIYNQAAEGLIRFVKKRPNNVSTYSETDLLNHKFKHGAIMRLIMAAVEYAPFQQTLASTRKTTFTRKEVERLMRQAHSMDWIQRSELATGGRVSRTLNRMMETLGRLDSLKNQGLYVGRLEEGVRWPDASVKKDLQGVINLAGVVITSAKEFVLTPMHPAQRREFARQLSMISAQARRIKRRSKSGAQPSRT